MKCDPCSWRWVDKKKMCAMRVTIPRQNATVKHEPIFCPGIDLSTLWRSPAC
jgi:hypothetical protein